MRWTAELCVPHTDEGVAEFLDLAVKTNTLGNSG